MLELTPKQIVSELDRYIIGQAQAKRAVAIALRNRWRRLNVPEEIREEITPKNIIMIGPTGVGKTEIARRLAKLTNSPFVKVEASKFTEVGYVGRDVDTIIRDLVESSSEIVREEQRKIFESKASVIAEEQLASHLHRYFSKTDDDPLLEQLKDARGRLSKRKIIQSIKDGLLNNKTIELEIEQSQGQLKFLPSFGLGDLEKDLIDAFSMIMPKKSRKRMISIQEAYEQIKDAEMEKLLDKERITTEAKRRVEAHGIVFIDEIDKVCSGELSSHSGPDISREGVQRDLLPLVEGTTVSTRYGPIITDHILFIAAGAFHLAKPSDLIPEFQGRFPIRVELSSLSKDDFIKILVEPKNALIKQYRSLMLTEGIELTFTDDAIEEIADLAFRTNEKQEDIGARRLATIMETLLEVISFDAPEIAPSKIIIDGKYVKERLSFIAKDSELAKYIL
ncbi:MAG: ATP-dependent protease ATPase subunit HslU [Deltaproteobacteria bacterium]|jgi:ATP-dependent HslUV protease ATP-binding subunit HslU|nr:ATP-dependent protease ATPase subunit HslU [Deltaproteobacteria bacterium]